MRFAPATSIIRIAPGRESLLPSLSRRLDRALELGYLAARHADGLAGLRALLACYAVTFRNPMSRDSVTLPLRHRGRRAVLHMRARDIYTVAEIFRERQYALSRPLPVGAVIVDAGANVGVASTWFRLEHPDATLIAIEPVGDNHELLARNLVGHPKAVAIQAAVGERSGRATMALAAHGAEHAVSNVPVTGGEEVAAMRLDAILDERGVRRVDLLKLDVEGSELDALRGLGERLSDVGAIVAEVHERQVDVDAFYRLLDEHGFAVVRRRAYREGRQNGVHTMEAWSRTG